MAQLDPQSAIFWGNYIRSQKINLGEMNLEVEAAPAGNFSITDSLIKLFLEKRKTAGSSILQDFESAGDAIPAIENYWIVLNGQQLPCLILKTIKIETHKFFEVPLSVAQAEGEGDLSLEYWREAHTKFYVPFLEKWGLKNISEAVVITEHFEEVYRSQNQTSGIAT